MRICSLGKLLICIFSILSSNLYAGDDGSVAEMVMPGDRIKMTAELINPIAIEQGMRFAIREGGRTVGAGVVSKILE